MPQTVNGIGTHYYGKKNLQTRPGTCEFCRRDTVLSSYDTRLWFVVVFIPIIPLGQKHILNYCPNCTRHRVISLAEWEKIKNKNLSEAMANMSANPQDAKAAIKAHSALVAFGQTAEAEKLMLLMKDRFANDAATQAYLGSMLQYVGKGEESLPYYQRALALDPELPEAKVAVALSLIQKNQLDEAHKLLSFLEAPGQTEYPGALLGLAYGYQRAGRHVEALKFFNLLLERFPKLAQDKKFRQAFKQSQAAAGSTSTLPPRKFQLSAAVVFGVAMAIILVIALVSNHYISQHRTLHLVSGFPRAVTVQIPNHGKVTVSRGGLWTMILPEGKYHATLSGGTNGTVDFTISSGFWARWFRKPCFVLNAGGSALLLFENTTYSANPNVATDPGGFSFEYGKSFVTFPNVDYPFVPAPDRLTLETKSSTLHKTHVEAIQSDVRDVFLSLARKNRLAEALDIAEWHLRIHPDDTSALLFYSYFADAASQQKRAAAYFAEAVKRRPVELEWHRMYQESRISVQHDAPKVIAEYDAMLQADPTNSSLLYLLGRLQTNKRKAIPLYEQAINRNPSNYFAHFALGQSYTDYGDWAKALPEIKEALRLNPDNVLFTQELFETRLAVKDFDALEKDLQAELRASPLDLQATSRLGDVYIAQGRTADLDKLLAACQSNVEAKDPREGPGLMADLRKHLSYSAGKFDEVIKLGSPKKNVKGSSSDNFDALVELGKLQEAADGLGKLDPKAADPFALLALSAAWKNAGNEEKAAATRAQAIDALVTDRPESEIVAGWLKAMQPVPLEEVMDLSLVPDRKKVLLVVLAQSFPENNAPFLAAARRLNVNRSFPYHLINRLTEVRPSPTPPAK